jgi:site-specific recombinase XerD
MKKRKTCSQIKKSSPVRKNKGKESRLESHITLFNRYLKNQRGLAPSSRREACRIGRLFLHFIFGSKALHLRQIKINDITSFINECAQHKSPHYVQHITSSLRSFLRFLKFEALVDIDFSTVVPHVAIWKQDQIPAFLTKQEVHQLLKGCDKSTSMGLRDYTILRLALGLGLRACEISNLTLEDFDWDNGVVVIRGKGSKISHLPITQDLGDDLVIYLLKGRPICLPRRFFVSINQPFHGLDSQGIGNIIGRALKRVGLKKKGRKAHSLRHTFATLLLNKGASLQEVGDVLRHQSINTTTIYAKVDFKRLRPLALPWLGNLSFGGSL